MSLYGNAQGVEMPPDTHMGGMLDADNANLINDVDMLPFDLNLNSVSTDMEMQSFGALPPSQDHSDVKTSVEPGDNQHTLTGDPLTGAGAGPLPASFGVQGASNTVTDFTKRRNWSQRVLEELKDFLHILTPDGCMSYVSPSAKALTGHDPSDLIGKFIFEFIHPDDSGTYVREFNESIATGNPLRFFYRFRKPDGKYAVFESFGHPHIGSEAASFGPNASASFCRGFFMMARPYPTKNAALLDSFLEHKIENERLRKRISDLKREEQEEIESHQRQWAKSREAQIVAAAQSTTPNGAAATESAGDASVPHTGTPASPKHYDGMPPPAKPSVSANALTRQNLDEALASSRPDSINDKMARYEGATHIETIEMLTGLRYRDGERSEGISTGAASPTLIRGDQGIAIVVDKDGRPAQSGRTYSASPIDAASVDKKKKIKVADEYVCTDCGTLDSPEWRKGPSGPKTLCNACGLRWAKKEKKSKGPVGGGDSNNGSGSHSAAQSAEPGGQPMQLTPQRQATLQGQPMMPAGQGGMPGMVSLSPPMQDLAPGGPP